MSKTTWKSTLCPEGSLVFGTFMKLLQISMFRSNKRCDDSINEILLYGAEDTEQMKQVGLNNLLSIYNVILQASRSVDVCVPSLSSDTLAKCLIDAHQKNKVKIRIFIHDSDDFHNLRLFAQNGIEVKIVSPDVRLGHEFMLVDAEAHGVALLGSLDHEPERPNCNRDATIMTSDKTLLTALNREFERVWNSMPNTVHEKDDKMIM